MLTAAEIEEWGMGQYAYWKKHYSAMSDWELIAAMREEEKAKALRLSSEAVKAARAKIETTLKGGRQ